MIITIDGPSASGKSTIAQLLAQHNTMYYINSGYLYRAYAYVMNTEPLTTHEQFLAHIKYEYINSPRVFWHSVDITHFLKTPEIDRLSSQISGIQEVRPLITSLQRKLARHHDIVIDGRDCGTVVFPNAEVKFFLTASVEVRARRWQHMQLRHGHLITLEEAIRLIAERDIRDSTRHIAPLTQPVDAILVDSTHLSIEEVCATMQPYIDLKLQGKS